jgi:hypothetical protein
LQSVTPIFLRIGDKADLLKKGKQVAMNMCLAENAKELLQICLKSIHDLTRRYYYAISAKESVPGTLSYLLSVKEADMVEILKVCGFYNKKGSFQLTVFQMWVTANFNRGTVEVTSFRRKAFIKIGLGEHPKRPLDQDKEKLDPPGFQMLAVGTEGKSSRDSLMRLFEESPSTAEPEMTAETSPTATPVKKMYQKFKITSLHKLDRLTDAVYCHIRKKQEDTSRNIVVRRQLDQVRQNRKRKFTVQTVAKREEKAEEVIAVKKERRVLL